MFSSDSSCELHTTLFNFQDLFRSIRFIHGSFICITSMATKSAHNALLKVAHAYSQALRSFHLLVAPQPSIFISVVCSSPAVHILMLAAVLLAAFGHSLHKPIAYTFGMLATVSALCNHHSLRSFYWLPSH